MKATPPMGDYQTQRNMAIKFAAVPLPPLKDKTVLDIGCDFGAWCQRAIDEGAAHVVGLDRGRKVGDTFINLAERNRPVIPDALFWDYQVGEQYRQFELFDVVLMLNVYHHAYSVSGDHDALWYWMWKQISPDGVLMWEAPVDTRDSVVRNNVRPELHGSYTEAAIRKAAERYFHIEAVGPGWVWPRVVWACRPRSWTRQVMSATVRDGAGGATRAFEYAGGRRMQEIERILGFKPYPGSLNLSASAPFDFDSHYYRSPMLDVTTRPSGLDSPWSLRQMRFYPVAIDGIPAYALRFEGERYPLTLVELIAPEKLRDSAKLHTGKTVLLTRTVPTA